MIAQQLQFSCRNGFLLAFALMMGACSSNVEKPDYPTGRYDGSSNVGHTAAHIALQQVGVPYQYGGQSPSGFDCSGLVQYAYQRAGKAVPRTTGQLWSSTRTVERNSMRPGDVLFFSISGKMSHVGLYLGDGRFVHAPSTGKTVSVESLASTYYANAFIKAGRPQ